MTRRALRARRTGHKGRSSHCLHRFASVLLACALVFVVVWAGLGAWFLSDRHRSEPVKSDAIVMLAGANDGRHRVARNLLEDGYAPELLVSSPDGAGRKQAAELCLEKATECFTPVPKTTAGEVKFVREAADEAKESGHAWHDIIVVTNKPHAARAGDFFRKCLDDEGDNGAPVTVRVVSIEGLDRSRLPIHVLREAAGFVKEEIISEAC